MFHLQLFSYKLSYILVIITRKSGEQVNYVNHEKIQLPYVISLYWLVKNEFPVSWIVIVSNVLASIIPQQNINQPSFNNYIPTCFNVSNPITDG
jgi:hypothetical protein